MDSFTKELVCNASAKVSPGKTLSSFTIFLPEQLNLEGQGKVAFSESSYPSSYQNVTEGNFMFFVTKVSNFSESYYLEPIPYHSFTDIVEAMNTLIQERHNHTETSIAGLFPNICSSNQFEPNCNLFAVSEFSSMGAVQNETSTFESPLSSNYFPLFVNLAFSALWVLLHDNF